MLVKSADINNLETHRDNGIKSTKTSRKGKGNIINSIRGNVKITKQPDISVVIPIHHEGRMVNHTLASVFRAAAYAGSKGILVEILAIMDQPDEKTLRFMKRTEKIQRYEVSFGDPGLSRNYGVEKSGGRYIAFVDGDDLFAEKWLWNVVAFLESRRQDMVVHPEYIVVFGTQQILCRQISSTSSYFELGRLMENNYWPVISAARKDVFQRFPYQATISTSGYGHEDWHFNCETLGSGIEHMVIPNSAAFIRKKASGSTFASENCSHRVIRATRLFSPGVFSRLLS